LSLFKPPLSTYKFLEKASPKPSFLSKSTRYFSNQLQNPKKREAKFLENEKSQIPNPLVTLITIETSLFIRVKNKKGYVHDLKEPAHLSDYSLARN